MVPKAHAERRQSQVACKIMLTYTLLSSWNRLTFSSLDRKKTIRMRKLIPADHSTWLAAKIRRRGIVLRRRNRRKSIHQNIVVTAPEILSLTRNAAGTIKFFDDFKAAVFTTKKVKEGGIWRLPSVYLDLSKITRISVPTAVILSAEMDRWRIRKNTHLSPRNLSSWAPRVRNLLADLGCFELVGTKKIRPDWSSIADAITVLKLRSGEKSNGKELQQLQYDLSRVFKAFKAQPRIYQGLLEAANNCIDHAYPKKKKIKPKYAYAGHRWWATACVDPKSNSLRFFIYDQGVGIPLTIGKKKGWLKALKILPGMRLSSDAAIIDGAFEIGKTSTGIDGRGRGLNQMREAIEVADDAYIRVISGKGDVKYKCNRGGEIGHLPAHIGGTIVEWSIPIDAIQ